MTKQSWTLVLLAVCFSMFAQAQRLNLMTYNIRHGAGMDGVVDFDRTAAVIRKANPDVVALQEVDSATRRCGGKDVALELARRTGMVPTFSAAISFDGGGYGVGLLSRERPVAVHRYPLPGREERRTLLVAEFKDYTVCCTHLSLTEEDCVASAEIICNVAKKLKHKPIFLMGDFNAVPGSALVTRLGKSFRVFTDSHIATCPADVPTHAIDYIMAWRKGANVRAEEVEVMDERMASDHRPVRARVAW